MPDDTADRAPRAAVAHPAAARRGRLFRKYLWLIMSLVTGALLVSGAIGLYFSYQEQKAALASLQREKAVAAASRIEQYIRTIEQQLRFAALPQLDAADVELRRIEFLKLLRQAPEITDIALLDGAGVEQIAVVAPRHGCDQLGQGSLAGAGVSQREERADLVRPGVLPQGDRAVHDDRRALRRRERPGDRRGRQPQVHLGRRLEDPHRRQGQGLRRRSQRLSRRRSRHRPRAAQDRPVAARARQGGGGHRAAGRAGAACRRDLAGNEVLVVVGADRAARLEGVRRAAGRPRSTRSSTRRSCAPASCCSRAS